jgi:hypothetical protein
LGPIYPLSQSELAAICKFLDEHLSIGFIRPTKSPYRAPILFIEKRDNSLRLCVDFHGLNVITWKDKYPISLDTDLLDALCILLRAMSGKTAFQTCYAIQTYKCACCLSAVCYSNDIFSNMLDIYVIVYLDNILVYSEDLTLHNERVYDIL